MSGLRLCALVVVVLSVAAAGGEKVYSGPIFDAHGHMGGSFDRATMIRVMDANDVSGQVLMARFYGGGPDDAPGNDGMSLALAAAHPGRFFPLVGMQRPKLTGADRWRDAAFIAPLLAEVDGKLASGKFYGIGEVIVRHFAYTDGPHAELDNPIDSALTRGLSDLAKRYDVPLVIHMEGDPALVADFSRLIESYPTVRYVWAHNCGRSHADAIRAMLVNHANLSCDLGAMTNTAKQNYGTGRPRREAYTALMEKGGRFFPAMQQLYEDFPDRFSLGMDVAHAQGMNHRNYTRRVKRFRHLLGQLTPMTAKRIAEDNARRLFTRTP